MGFQHWDNIRKALNRVCSNTSVDNIIPVMRILMIDYF